MLFVADNPLGYNPSTKTLEKKHISTTSTTLNHTLPPLETTLLKNIKKTLDEILK